MKFKLRDYQQDAVDFFKENKRVLFKMACSAGKTLTSICCIEKLPVLIVTLSVAKYQFKEEIEKFMGDKYTVEILNGREIKKLPPAHIYIINPEILYSNRFLLRDADFQLIIYDEVHYAKNPKSKRQKASVFIGQNVPYKIAMTATPLPNTPCDYFGQLQVLYPERFGNRSKKFPNRILSWYDFAIRYSDGKKNYFGHFTHTKWTSPAMKKEFFDRAKNIIFEVTEDQVMKEVPPCNIIDWKIELPRKYRKEYTKIHKEFEKWLKEQDLTPYEVFKKMTTQGLSRTAELRKIISEVKTQYTIDFLKGFESLDKVVIFTWFKEGARILQEHYGKEAVSITGQQSNKQKEENRQSFLNDPKVKYAIVNVMSGGTGLNLHHGVNTVIFSFLPHNWSSFEQAYKRVWRTGQKKAVNVYKLLVDNTIDIDMDKVIYEKKKL